MKTSNLLLILAATAAPLALFADSDTDRKIEKAASSSYNFHAVLEDRVKANADDGIVTLTGTVRDRDEKNLAEDTVNSLPGVISVKDQVVVSGAEPEESDGWISFKARSMLLTRANVSARTTHVDVKDGVVTLTGTADSQAQKELTDNYIKDLKGVKSVENHLVVQGASGNGQPMAAEIDDASITAQVKLALLDHRATSALSTKVETTDGTVRISGEAGNDAEKDLVSVLAKKVRGVKSVENQMTVKS
jgi:osmotically-inducible protein OsmY